MQSLNQPVPQNACDVGLLPVKRVLDFRAFLDGQNVQTREGRGGQYFHVRTTAGWAPIQRGKRDQVATPVSLRAVVEDFLKAPIGKAILSSNSRSLFQELPEFPAGATEAQKITSLVATAQGISYSTLVERIAAKDATTLASLQPEARAFLGIDPANGPSLCIESVSRVDESGILEVIDIRTADHRQEKALSARQREYLRDLRDDFALRAPLVMNEGETMASFADRCWKFADLMIEHRPTMAGD
jgi:hypothetical protein